MTNNLVGEVYLKIIEDVVEKSRIAFEEFGVAAGTLEELQQEWQSKLSQRGAAVMPWDPKPVQPSPAPAAAPPSNITNGLPPSSYYDNQSSNVAANGNRLKQESGSENQHGGLPNTYPQSAGPPQGGAARAAQLMQQQYGQAASASVNAMQRGGGLALPGQQQAKPQGLHLPAQSPPPGQPQYSPQQQQAMRQQQQQQQQMQQQQQQAQPRVKVENDSPHLAQGSFPQQTAQPNYSQTDGADEGYEQWQTMLAQRRALHAEQGQHVDSMMRDQIMAKSAELQSGLMMPLDELPSTKRLKRSATSNAPQSSSAEASITQLDGVDEDDEKADVKDEDDENAINSDLDDSDDEGQGPMGDEDDDNLDSILCTYDKVQRVKNKWKCTLKDGIMSANGKEWVFHKGMGEFEW